MQLYYTHISYTRIYVPTSKAFSEWTKSLELLKSEQVSALIEIISVNINILN